MMAMDKDEHAQREHAPHEPPLAGSVSPKATTTSGNHGEVRGHQQESVVVPSKATAQSEGRQAEQGQPEGEQEVQAGKARTKRVKNNVRKIRMEKMMSKAELARRAGMSTLTIDRVERGLPCRMDTKRKILEALGLKPADRVMVFGEDD